MSIDGIKPQWGGTVMDAKQAYGTDIVEELNEVIRRQFNLYNVVSRFSNGIGQLGERDVPVQPCSGRRDMRDENTFTIDCADCKDMDDAVSLAKTPSGYRLAVHIADVAAYVPVGSELDIAASDRATSIYLPGLTIPMLPEVLSNNLCSLNPGVDRLTLSVIICLDHKGKVIASAITKGLIRSRVKGVYAEVNALLSGTAGSRLARKYSQVMDVIYDMAELYKILRSERIQNGATVSDSNKPKIHIDKHSVVLTPTADGIAENMIEEFMILANRVVAEYLCDNDLPGIFRIQESKHQLAAYRPIRSRHAELALENYSHFTSPIRRVADLKIHQILTMHLNGIGTAEIKRTFNEALEDVCDRATKRSRTAKQIQSKCEYYCYEQFFRCHKSDTYTGTVVGFDRENRPIVQIAQYNIKMIGCKLIDGIVGEQVCFHVGINRNNNRLFAARIRKMAV